MSTVFWAYQLHQGEITCQEEDLFALYQHSRKLNDLCIKLGHVPLSEFIDHTDLKFNRSELALPDGCQSTKDLMRLSGVWIEAQSASASLYALRNFILENKTRFGLFSNQHLRVVEELDVLIPFVDGAVDRGAKFNLAVIM